MKASSCPNLNRETTSFPNFFTLFQDPDRHDNDTTTLNKRPKIDRGDDTEASEASPFKDILSSFVSFHEMNEPGYLPDCWDQEDDQTLAKWPPSPNGSDSNASVGSNQFNPESPGIHRGASKMSESMFDFFLNELVPPRFEQALGSLSTSSVVDPLYHEHYSRSSFKRFSSSALSPPSTMNLVRRPNNQERAITFFRNLNLVTVQERAQRRRPMSSTQLHHMISERNRREKLIESFLALQSLLPLGTQKDKASVLATTTDYLASLKAQVEELTKTSRDLEERVQLLATKKEAANDHQELISLFSDQRLNVRITHEVESTSQARVIGLQVVLRRELNAMDLVTRMLEFMRQVVNASLLSVEVDAPVVDSINPINIVIRLRLRIEKDEVSLLASTMDYLFSLKAQVDELDKRAKHLEEEVQFLTTKEDANDHQEVSLSPNQRLDVRITEEAQALIIGLLSQTNLYPNPHFQKILQPKPKKQQR